jgi:hypothetical protein
MEVFGAIVCIESQEIIDVQLIAPCSDEPSSGLFSTKGFLRYVSDNILGYGSHNTVIYSNPLFEPGPSGTRW